MREALQNWGGGGRSQSKLEPGTWLPLPLILICRGDRGGQSCRPLRLSEGWVMPAGHLVPRPHHIALVMHTFIHMNVCVGMCV